MVFAAWPGYVDWVVGGGAECLKACASHWWCGISAGKQSEQGLYQRAALLYNHPIGHLLACGYLFCTAECGVSCSCCRLPSAAGCLVHGMSIQTMLCVQFRVKWVR